jgi:hypothetical protein
VKDFRKRQLKAKLAGMSNGVSIEDRRKLAEARVTLDGRPAVISGIQNDFAKVTVLDTGESYTWSWPGVKRVIETAGGHFKS